jgi:hypothetical protein
MKIGKPRRDVSTGILDEEVFKRTLVIRPVMHLPITFKLLYLDGIGPFFNVVRNGSEMQ